MSTNLDIIREIIEYIDAHLEERLDLDSLCKECGFSKYHLCRIFSDWLVYLFIVISDAGD